MKRASLVLLLLFSFASITGAQTTIQWRSGSQTIQSMSPEQLSSTFDDVQRNHSPQHIIVALKQPATPDARATMKRFGVELLSPLGGNAWTAAIIPQQFRGNELMQTALIDSVGELTIDQKLHPFFQAFVVPPWAIVDADIRSMAVDLAAASDQTRDLVLADLDPVIAVYALFHDDVPKLPNAWAVVAATGGTVRSQIGSVNALVVELPASAVTALASNDEVLYIEPVLPKLSEMNNSSRARIGADMLQERPYGLDGTGVSVLIFDSGAVFAHEDFGDRLIVGDTDEVSDHSTHVAGTVAGDGTVSEGLYRGMAPNAQIVSYGFEADMPSLPGFLYTDPGDIEDNYDEAMSVHGAVIANNSIGTNTASNLFPCEWTGDYGVTSSVIDSIVRGSLGQPMRIVWANGNERSTSRCGNLYATTAPPACAKNHITVGALYSDTDEMTPFSSWGPADDGRMKPDISAPGCEVGDDKSVTSTAFDGEYLGRCGTSMAAPAVTGIGALLIQEFRNQYPGQDDLRNSTLKALLAHTADDRGHVGPDYQYGYGSVRGIAAVDQLRSGSFAESVLNQGEAHFAQVIVGPGDTELRVTISWDDPAAVPNVQNALVNDLDIVVYDVGGAPHLPWTLDPQNPDQPAIRTQANHRDNIEQVVIDAAVPGVYLIEVSGTNVPVPGQLFSIVASPVLLNCTSTGVVSFDSAIYPCGAVTMLQVNDCDLNESGQEAETVAVLVTSDSQPGGVVIELTETAESTGVFRGELQLTTVPRVGQLVAANEDLLTVQYIDADDGMGNLDRAVVQTAIVDCEQAQIASLLFTDVTPQSAMVVVQLSEPAVASLDFGASCVAPDRTERSTSPVFVHTFALSDLEPDTHYFIRLRLNDAAGNETDADNGGMCYSLQTPALPNFFTQTFAQEQFDLAGRSVTLTPDGSYQHYRACVEDITELPFDPDTGTLIALEDDDHAEVELTGAACQLYGVSYASIHVGSNGYITFGVGDDDHSESLEDHFALPRVSALFTDLNPEINGEVRWQQLDDRVVVSWRDVPEFDTPFGSTFQVESHFDGTIRMSWSDVAATTGLVGVSDGAGLSQTFFPADLSQSPSCEAHPPVAMDAMINTPSEAPIEIVLTATDDGLPDPPGELQYRIASLPIGVLRDAGNDQVISQVELPYTLISFGDRVVYEPAASFKGTTGFTFVADDDGELPLGGVSNVATITIDVGGPTLFYDFSLDDEPQWMMDGAWEFGAPTGGGSHNHDPASAFSGVNVLGHNIDGDYANDMIKPEYVTPPPLDFHAILDSQLRFQRWLGIEAAPYDNAHVQLSTDGDTWHTIWSNTGKTIEDTAWTQQIIDLSSLADGAPHVQLRWGIGPTDGSASYPSWNLDDIQIWGTPRIFDIGDVNEDGSVDVFDLIEILAAWGPCSTSCPPSCAADTNEDCVIDIFDLLAIVNTWTQLPANALAQRVIGAAMPPTVDALRKSESERGDAADEHDETDVFINDGVLRPAIAGGAQIIDSAYRQTRHGALEMVIAGTAPLLEHDIVVITGHAMLHGILDVRLEGGHQPVQGDQYDLLIAAAIGGNFDEMQLPRLPHGLQWRVIRDAQVLSLRVESESTPPSVDAEPAASLQRVLDGVRRAAGPAHTEVHSLHNLMQCLQRIADSSSIADS